MALFPLFAERQCLMDGNKNREAHGCLPVLTFQ
jgi:hypothetical protein